MELSMSASSHVESGRLLVIGNSAALSSAKLSLRDSTTYRHGALDRIKVIRLPRYQPVSPTFACGRLTQMHASHMPFELGRLLEAHQQRLDSDLLALSSHITGSLFYERCASMTFMVLVRQPSAPLGAEACVAS